MSTGGFLMIIILSAVVFSIKPRRTSDVRNDTSDASQYTIIDITPVE